MTIARDHSCTKHNLWLASQSPNILRCLPPSNSGKNVVPARFASVKKEEIVQIKFFFLSHCFSITKTASQPPPLWWIVVKYKMRQNSRSLNRSNFANHGIIFKLRSLVRPLQVYSSLSRRCHWCVLHVSFLSMVTSRIFKFWILNFSPYIAPSLFRAVLQLNERLPEEPVFHGCHQFVSILIQVVVCSFPGVSCGLKFMEE